MKMKNYLSLVPIVGVLSVACGHAAAPGDEEILARVRTVIKADRQAVVTQVMQLSETESKAFWPLYQQYRSEMDKVAEGVGKLVLEYAAVYPDVPDERAKKMLKDLTELEQKKVDIRADYLKKFGKVLPAHKNLRLAQVESRLDAAVQIQLAAAIPLTPIEGRLTGKTTGAVIAAEGVPGGALVKTYHLNATVTATDAATRRVTLLGPDGIKQTVKVGPEAINFEQIHVGDKLNVTVAAELVIYVAGEGETPTDTAKQVVVVAPQGAKPGGIVASTTQVTAKVTAIDTEQHQATLQFEDGTTRTVAVRPDVDLAKRKIGEKVVIQTTEALALEVVKP